MYYYTICRPDDEQELMAHDSYADAMEYALAASEDGLDCEVLNVMRFVGGKDVSPDTFNGVRAGEDYPGSFR